MIMNVIHNHQALYEGIVSRHAALYEKHWAEIILRTNTLLRRCDMNWLDETGDPINLRALKRQREMYESMLAVRVHRRLHRWMDRLPRPLAGAAKGALGFLRRAAWSVQPPTTGP
jgi:hypothetical protein